jgi:hypothetical protein
MGRDHAEDLGVDGKIILDGSMLREIRWKYVDWMHLGSCRHGNEHSDTKKGGKFLD